MPNNMENGLALQRSCTSIDLRNSQGNTKMSCSKLISSCYMKFFKTLNLIRSLPIDKTSLTRSMRPLKTRKKKFFENRKSLSASMNRDAYNYSISYISYDYGII